MIQGLQSLVNGSGVEKVAEYVEKGLAGAFTAAGDFILSFFHLDAIPRTIRRVSDKWVDIVPRKLAELLGRLKGALLEQLQKLWGGYWGRAEWTAGNEKHKIWVDFRSGKVSMASTKQEPSAYVKDLRRRAAKNEKAATAAGKAADALAVAEKTAGEVPSATARAANKGASESERASAVKAARSASAKAQESLSEFAKDAGEAEKELGSCSKRGKGVEKQGLFVHNASAPCSPQGLMPGQSKILDKEIVVVTTHAGPKAPRGATFNFIRVRKMIGNLKYLGSSRSREPDTFMRQLIKYGELTLPGTTLGLPADDVGHIVGNQFGGYANKSMGNGNVFPQNATVNRVELNKFESITVKDATDKECEVCIEIEFFFEPASTTPHRPTHFTYKWWVDGVQQPTRDFMNPK